MIFKTKAVTLADSIWALLQLSVPQSLVSLVDARRGMVQFPGTFVQDATLPLLLH